MAQQNYNMGITNQQRGSWNNQVTKQNENITKKKTKAKAKAKTKTKTKTNTKKTKTNTKKTKNTGGRRQSRRSGGRRTKIHRRKIKKKGRQTKRKRRQLKGGMDCDSEGCDPGWCHTDAQMSAVINGIAGFHLESLPDSGSIFYDSGVVNNIPGSEVILVQFRQSSRLGGWCIHNTQFDNFVKFCYNPNWTQQAHQHGLKERYRIANQN